MRNTDKDWQKIGRDDPFWGVCSAPEFRTGTIDEAGREKFYRSGERDIARVEARMLSLYDTFQPETALDFGCGAGRLVVPMARIAKTAYGIDVSQGMLDKAREYLDANQIDNVILQTAIPDTGLDWINSYIVLQHIPPRRGLELLASLLGRLSVGGFVSIQFIHSNRRARRSRMWRYLSRIADLAPVGTIRMYEYDIGRVRDVLQACGVTAHAYYPTDHGGHYGVWVFDRKDKS